MTIEVTGELPAQSMHHRPTATLLQLRLQLQRRGGSTVTLAAAPARSISSCSSRAKRWRGPRSACDA